MIGERCADFIHPQPASAPATEIRAAASSASA
jgi:hypothetical protein